MFNIVKTSKPFSNLVIPFCNLPATEKSSCCYKCSPGFGVVHKCPLCLSTMCVVPGAHMAWRRACWAPKGWCSRLKQQVRKERVKPLITYCDGDGGGKRLKGSASLCSISPMELRAGGGSCGSALMCDFLTVERAWTKPGTLESGSLMDFGSGGLEEGLGVENTGYWARVQKSVFMISLLLLPNKQVSANTPGEDLCPRLQIKRPRNEGIRTGNANFCAFAADNLCLYHKTEYLVIVLLSTSSYLLRNKEE